MAEAVDGTDVLVAHHTLGHEAVVREALEHGGEHGLEAHPGQVGPDATVHAQPEPGMAVGEPVEGDLVGIVKGVRVVVGQAVGHPDSVSRVKLVSPDLAVLGDRPSAALGRRDEAHEFLGGGIEEARVVHQARALIGTCVEPGQRMGGERGGGVEAPADEEGEGAEDVVVDERGARCLCVHQSLEHARTGPGAGALHLRRQLSRHDERLVEHPRKVGAVRGGVDERVGRLAVDDPVGEREAEHAHRQHGGDDVGEVVHEVEAARLDDLVDACVAQFEDHGPPPLDRRGGEVGIEDAPVFELLGWVHLDEAAAAVATLRGGDGDALVAVADARAGRGRSRGDPGAWPSRR